jgi:hypothetical protein
MSDPYQPPSGSYPPSGQYPPSSHPQPTPYGQAPQPPYAQAPQPPYGYAPYPYPVAAPFNGLAIASFVLSLVWLYGVGSILALVFGLVALRQITRTGQRGRGLAIAGVVISAVTILLLVLATVAFLVAHGLHTTSTVEVPGLTT